MKKLLLVLMLMPTVLMASDYQPAAGANGAQIYREACAACHGDDGMGKFGLFFDLSTSVMLADERKKVIQQGGMMMPSFANINGKELDGLVAYIQSLGDVVAVKEK